MLASKEERVQQVFTTLGAFTRSSLPWSPLPTSGSLALSRNFDEIRFDYYRDETVAFESFKAGNLDYHRETSAKNWATACDFAAVREGWVKRQEVQIKTAQPMRLTVAGDDEAPMTTVPKASARSGGRAVKTWTFPARGLG
jgi:hypothetical protein